MVTTWESDHLVRAPSGYVGGVCEGLGRHMGLDPVFLRVAFVVGTVVSFGGALFLYGALWWVLPRAGEEPLEPVVWETGSDGRHHPPLVRTTNDRRLAGVCGGLARRYGVDPSLVRLGVLFAATVSLGIVAVAYGVAALVMPSANQSHQQRSY